MTDASKERKPQLFVRNATGLTREVGLLDAFIFNLAANPVGLALVFILGFQIGLFPGSDPILAMLIVLPASLLIAATYAQLSAAFPRSGGDYIFNGRILHPALGFGFNFSLSFWEWLTASLCLSFITTLGISPAVVMLGYLAGNSALVSLGVSLSSPLTVLLIGTVFNILVSYLFLTGIRKTVRFLDVFYVTSFVGFLLIIIALLQSTPTTFQSNLNSFLAAVGSNQTYTSLIGAARGSGLTYPAQSSLYLPAMVGVVSIEAIWFFWSNYIGGEIKRGSSLRRQSTAMLGAAVFNGLLTLVALALFLRVIGSDFLTAFSYLITYAPSLIPFAPATVSGSQVVLFASLAAVTPLVELLIPILFIGWNIVVVIDFAMQPVRSLFAWSMDRVAPSKFAEVNQRFHTPVYSIVVGALIMEAGLVAQLALPGAVFLIFTASIVAPAFSSMFLTGLSGVALPLRKNLFGSSVLSRLRVAGIPLISITGAATSGFVLFLVYVFFSYDNFFLNNPLMEFLAFGFNLVGVALYFVVRAYRKRQGVDLRSVFREIPPE